MNRERGYGRRQTNMALCPLGAPISALALTATADPSKRWAPTRT